MIKTLIVTGGNLKKDFFHEIYLNNKFDYIIASDKGLEVLDKCNVKPNYIIGDFDSLNKEILKKYVNDNKIKIIKLNPEKDYTDTHMALKLAIEINSTNITIIGGVGTRIDHTLANIHILKESLDNNIECKIEDNKNKIQLINRKTILELDENYRYISLIPLTTMAKGVTLTGFKYPLSNATLEAGHSIGVSNEQIEKRAEINLKEGILI